MPENALSLVWTVSKLNTRIEEAGLMEPGDKVGRNME
jgi:hypothetical protein